MFFIWKHRENLINKFTEEMDQFFRNLKFNCETFKEKVAVLDPCVGLKNGMIITDLHTKIPNYGQCIHCNS